jgi:ankyrin repeat protein
LSSLPSTLDENYKEAIQRIERSPTKSLAFRVLTWIVYAVRPLQLEEVLHAIAIDELEPEDEAVTKDCLTPPSTIVNACVGMIRIDKESNVVGLVHKTTQEYFEKNGSNYFPHAHRDITTSCFRYLSLHTFSSGPCSDELFNGRLRENPLLEYVVRSLADHISRGFDHSLKNMALRIFLDKQTMSSASQVLFYNRQYMRFREFRKQFQGVHFAAYFCLTEILKLLVETGNVDVDSKDSEGRTPLFWAAAKGHEVVVKLLVETGNVDVNSKDSEGRTPLCWAAENGHKAVVNLLLEYKADASIKGRRDQTPLLTAAYSGDEAVAKRLLEYKAEVNTQDNNGRTPLSFAAMNGHEAMAKLLLEYMAEINTQDKDGQTPLRWATIYKYKAMAKLLLEYKAEINIQDKYGRTPLWWAVRNGDEAMAKLLLDYKAEVNIQEEDGGTPLSLAARGGHEAVVKLLLEYKAEVNIKDKKGRTPSFWAAWNEHEAIVRLLSL